MYAVNLVLFGQKYCYISIQDLILKWNYAVKTNNYLLWILNHLWNYLKNPFWGFCSVLCVFVVLVWLWPIDFESLNTGGVCWKSKHCLDQMERIFEQTLHPNMAINCNKSCQINKICFKHVEVKRVVLILI